MRAIGGPDSLDNVEPYRHWAGRGPVEVDDDVREEYERGATAARSAV